VPDAVTEKVTESPTVLVVPAGCDVIKGVVQVLTVTVVVAVTDVPAALVTVKV
jgi:hypothetical protein